MLQKNSDLRSPKLKLCEGRKSSGDSQGTANTYFRAKVNPPSWTPAPENPKRQVLLKIVTLCSSCFFLGQSRYVSVLPGTLPCGS